MAEPKDQSTFLLEEYKRLCDEIKSIIEEIRKSEHFALIAIGAIWAYLGGTAATNDLVRPMVRPALWLPSLVCGLMVVKNYFQGLQMKRLGEYLRSVEKHFLEDKTRAMGWETFLNTPRKEIPKYAEFVRSRHYEIYWILVFVVTIVVPLAITLRP